jgi:hypothetical protein
MESAYPGFGEFVLLHRHDHVSITKPRTREEVAYAKTLEFLREIVQRVEQQEQQPSRTATTGAAVAAAA